MVPKYGIIGCGHMSGYYFDYLEKVDASVVHVADLDVERTKELWQRFGANNQGIKL